MGYFPNLPSAMKERILRLASSFPALLQQMKLFTKIQIPPSAWFAFFQMNTDGNDRRKVGEEGHRSNDQNGSRARPKER